MRSGFYNLNNFEAKKCLEENSDDIISEVLSMPPDRMLPWHEKEIFSGGWYVYPILLVENSFQLANEMMPKTLNLLKKNGCVQAGISVLKGNTEIFPHSDNINQDVLLSSKTYRLQLGINVPNDCFLRVENDEGIMELKHWENGKVLAFDSSRVHSAKNNSERNRIVLIADFIKEDIFVSKDEISKLESYYLNLYGLA